LPAGYAAGCRLISMIIFADIFRQLSAADFRRYAADKDYAIRHAAGWPADFQRCQMPPPYFTPPADLLKRCRY